MRGWLDERQLRTQSHETHSGEMLKLGRFLLNFHSIGTLKCLLMVSDWSQSIFYLLTSRIERVCVKNVKKISNRKI